MVGRAPGGGARAGVRGQRCSAQAAAGTDPPRRPRPHCLAHLPGPADVAVKVRLVDFAHTFRRAGGGRRDANFLAGLRAVIARLAAVARLEAAEQLPML